MIKFKRKIICFLILFGCFLIGRIYLVNWNVPEVQTEYYSIGESITMDNGEADETDEKLKNYSMKVEKKELMTAVDFCEKYQFEQSEETAYTYSYYYLVIVSFYNHNQEDDNSYGISLNSIVLLKDDGYIMLNEDAFLAVNPNMPGTGFALRGDSGLTMTLVYGIGTENGSEVKDGEVKHLRGLLVTEAPVRKIYLFD